MMYDESETGLPDLTIVQDPHLVKEKTVDQKNNEDELVMPENPMIGKSARDIFVMRNEKKVKENVKLTVNKKVKFEEPNNKDEQIVNDEDGINEEVEDELQFKVEDIMENEVKTKRGKRGNDKKPRKKRVMTDKQKENLKRAREKSLAVRRAKKEAKLKAKNEKNKVKGDKVIKPSNHPITQSPQKTQPLPIPVLQQAPMDFDHFCSLMDRYEERKAKRTSQSQEPHPNKKIPLQHKPRPPIQKVQRNYQEKKRVIVNEQPAFDAYSVLHNRKGSLFGSSYY